MENFTYKDITFTWQENILTIKNSRLCRRIDFNQGLPRTLDLTIDTIKVSDSNPGFDFQLAGFPLPGHKQFLSDYQAQDVTFAELEQPDGAGAKITVRVFESIRNLELRFSYILYCNMPFAAVTTGITSAVTPLLYWNPRQNHKSFRVLDSGHAVNTV